MRKDKAWLALGGFIERGDALPLLLCKELEAELDLIRVYSIACDMSQTLEYVDDMSYDTFDTIVRYRQLQSDMLRRANKDKKKKQVSLPIEVIQAMEGFYDDND